MAKDTKSLRLLLGYLWPKEGKNFKYRIAFALFFLIFSKVANVLTPILFKQSIDSLSLNHEHLTFFTLPIALIIAYGMARVAAQLFNELKEILFAKVAQRAIRTIALHVFKHLHSMSLGFHLERKTGAISRIMDRGLKAVESLLTYMVFNIIPILVEILFVSIILWFLFDATYMLITLLTLVAYITTTLIITNWRIDFVRHMNAADNDSQTKAIDSLLNYETVKYFGNEDHEARRFDQGLEKYEHAAIKSKLSLSVLNLLQGIIIAAGLITLMCLAAYDVSYEKFTIGDFVLVNTYLIQLYLPLNFLGYTYREIKMSLVNIEHMFDLLAQRTEVKDPTNPRPLKLLGGEVVFDRVSFAYNARRPILQNVSFKVPAGKTIAIVGSSGAGKSTISRLLFRFYDVDKGHILIDGQDIRTVPQQELREAIGMVPQDTVLFNDSILYNISYGKPQASRKDIISAAKLAHIHDFIISLPEGYDSLVGERGLKLSGGEKQRVAIARTLLKRPTIFLFDEASSALDTRTEKEIQKNLQEVSKNHTTLIIAHRLSTVIDADEIIVLDHGRIIERGSHHALLAQDGKYSEMWKKQMSTKDKSILTPN